MTPPDPSCVAALERVGKVFGQPRHETVALRELSFQARAGEFVLLLGPSGSGKTTFLTILAGLQRPSTGRVILFGRDLAEYRARQLQRLRAAQIGFIFQTFHLLDALNVIENVLLVARFAGLPAAAARSRANLLLQRFGIERLAGANPRTLSQGERQRVAVARAFMNDPRLIIADEPTGSLASAQGFEVVRLISESVSGEGRCAIVASHDERIAEYAHRVLRLSDGELSAG